MIHLFGSVAYDRIMTFPGRFEDHILADKLHILNVSFVLDGMEEKRGGTAGNIAYSLALLGEKSRVCSTVGKDFAGYDAELERLGVNLDGVKRLSGGFTAGAYITTDQKGNQITGFNPGAMNTPCGPEYYPQPAPGDWGAVAPGNVEDMEALPALFRKTGTPYIFDPGQQVLALCADALAQGLTGAAVLVGNDYEISMVSSKTGLSKDELLERAGCLITTLGGEGSVICRTGQKPVRVAAAKISRVADPTGAGDAYRAGLLTGLHSGLDMEVSAALGATCAAFCVERYGTQEHAFTPEEFRTRFEDTYGPMPDLNW